MNGGCVRKPQRNGIIRNKKQIMILFCQRTIKRYLPNSMNLCDVYGQGSHGEMKLHHLYSIHILHWGEAKILQFSTLQLQTFASFASSFSLLFHEPIFFFTTTFFLLRL